MCVREDLTLIFLSAEPDTKSVESEEMSKESTGSLWPYKDRKNLRLSVKNTWELQSTENMRDLARLAFLLVIDVPAAMTRLVLGKV